MIGGAIGEARRVPDDALRAMLSGDEVATLEYWWIKLEATGLLIAHADDHPADIQSVGLLEMIVPQPEEQMNTFVMSVITLADLPGVTPARKRFPWMTHELIVFTVDTTRGPVPFDSPMPWALLSPHNLSIQFELDDDDQARVLGEKVAAAIVAGVLPAEIQAFIPERRKMMTLAPLYELWEDTVRATAEHLRTGGTHEEPHP